MSYGQFLFPPFSSLLKLECLLNWGLHLRRYKGGEKDGNHFIWNTHLWTALKYSFLCLPYTLPLPFNQASRQCAQLCMCVLKRWRVNYKKWQRLLQLRPNMWLGCFALHLCTFLMEVHASSEFTPTSVYTDYLTAAVLASSNSLVYKRVKLKQVEELGEYDDTR